MLFEELIKELIDEISGIEWSPGMYPQSLSNIKQQPTGAWSVVTGSGTTTSTRQLATVETTVTISLWAGSAEGRATAKKSVLSAFTGVGFMALTPSDAEVSMDDNSAAYVSTMIFKGWIDTVTYWVYQIQR